MPSIAESCSFWADGDWVGSGARGDLTPRLPRPAPPDSFGSPLGSSPAGTEGTAGWPQLCPRCAMSPDSADSHRGSWPSDRTGNPCWPRFLVTRVGGREEGQQLQTGPAPPLTVWTPGLSQPQFPWRLEAPSAAGRPRSEQGLSGRWPPCHLFLSEWPQAAAASALGPGCCHRPGVPPAGCAVVGFCLQPTGLTRPALR